MSQYGASARTLHRIALGPRAMRELAFDLDQRLGAQIDPDASPFAAPVFVTGLARSGTSILLRTLYRTGAFCTLTYRNMPFVLAPRLWGRLAHRFGTEGDARERAHGDGLAVDFDTPEAFEEVFWLTFAGERYLRADRLRAHDVDEKTGERFRRFVGAIADADRQAASLPDGSARRYLSKNNNNVLRLEALRRAVPHAAILVPFRRPEDQATSLLRQHRRFRETHAADPFGRQYMRWLGHFEFGADHRPFDLSDAHARLAGQGPDRLDYWLIYWTAVYEAVLACHEAAGVRLFDYDAFCAAPAERLDDLFQALSVDADAARFAADITPPTPYDPPQDADPSVLAGARSCHDKLREKATPRSP